MGRALKAVMITKRGGCFCLEYYIYKEVPMKKKQSSWIPAGLFTIATTIATIYTLLEYRSSVLIVGIASLLLLLSAFWLFTCIARQNRQEKTPTVGQEQRERMNYEGMKLQGEELIRLVNSLGKGTYVYSKRSAEHLQTLLDASLQMQQNTEKLLNGLIQQQTKAAKYQVKNSQENTARMVHAFSENAERLNHTLEAYITAIQSNTPQPVQTDTGVTDKLSDLTKELAHINSSILALQLQLTSLSSQPVYTSVPPQAPPEQIVTSVPVIQQPEESKEPVSDTNDIEPSTEAIPDEDIEQLFTAEPEEPVPDTVGTDTSAETILNEDIEQLVSTEQEEIPVSDDASDSVLDEVTEAQAAVPEPEPAVAAIPSDNPNKQLSAEEIAALFSALG